MHLSKVLDKISAQIAATEIGFPRIDPELSINIVTRVSLKSVSFSFLKESEFKGSIINILLSSQAYKALPIDIIALGILGNFDTDLKLYMKRTGSTATSNITLYYNDYCDYVQLNWEEDILADSYKLYRDNELIIQLSNGVNQYSDYQAIAGVNHEYCIKSTNDCGDSNSICSYGSRKPVPDVIESISASDGTSQDYIMIEWNNSGQDLIYKLYRDGIQLSVLSGNQNLTYNDEFVELNTIYEYCVEAQNDCGNSDWACDEGYLGIGMIGDINLDNVLDVLDVVLLLNFILEIQIPDNNQIWLSDINSDQLMNILDIVALVSLILN